MRKQGPLRQVLQRLTPLGIAQLVTLGLAVVTLIASVLWLHHQTSDYFIPLPAYLQSIKIAVPPAALFIGTYAIAFLGGIAIGDVPKTALQFARNRFFQSFRMMGLACSLMLLLCAYSTYVLLHNTPPAYEKFLALLLSGSSDNLKLARDQIDSFRASNPVLAAEFGKAVEVFAERNAVNAGVKQLSGERSRTLVRALEVVDDEDWRAHPLRKHALAEAYLLFGQSFDQAGRLVGLEAPGDRNPYGVAISLYEGVAANSSQLAPDILRASARNNIGNAYYYLQKFDLALNAWRASMNTNVGRDNLGTWGNIIAALILIGKPEEAVAEGERARSSAERTGRAFVDTYQYAGILENTGFARLQLKKDQDALKDFAAANAFREDDLTRQNLALALIVNRRSADAQKILRQIAPPIDGSFTAEANPKIAACVYLIWALALQDAPVADRAANFLSFLGERHSAEEMKRFDAGQMTQLLRRVSDALPRAADPCASISRIEAIVALLRS